MVERLFFGEFIFSVERTEHVCKLTVKSWDRDGRRRRSHGGDSPGLEAAGDSGPRRPAREGPGEQQGGAG